MTEYIRKRQREMQEWADRATVWFFGIGGVVLTLWWANTLIEVLFK